MTESDLRKREARLTAREARLMRRERDLTARVAELSDAADDASDSALDALLRRPTGARRDRLPTLVYVVAGLWLMVAPLVLGYAQHDPQGATVACGAALALLGLWRLADPGDSAPAPWIAAGVATILLAVATLADQGAVASFDDAGAGVVVWAAVIAVALL